ncbi:hypothetical protein IV102_34635 [bacterium]|nr:hypothetical protein [bacterium]
MERPHFSIPWTERLRWLRFDDSRVVGLLCLACLAGSVGFFGGGAPSGSPKDLPTSEPHVYDLKVQGELLGVSPIQLQDVRVTLYFPQMPFQVTRRWQQIEHPKANSFSIPLKFQVDCPASLCLLRLQIGDKKLQIGKIQVRPGTQALSFQPATVRL